MPREPNLTIAPSMTEYFNSVVDAAIRDRQVRASAAAKNYLVGLLCDFAHPDEHHGSALDRPLTFLLQEALEAPATDRFRRLRTLGDGVLYVLGFFGSHVDQRGAGRGYVVMVGRSAYDRAASMLKFGGGEPNAPDVLTELATKFEDFARVLTDVSEGALASSSARDERSVIRMYERWLQTGSSKLAEELGAQGIMPVKRAVGVN